jgi:hypothetical protein
VDVVVERPDGEWHDGRVDKSWWSEEGNVAVLNDSPADVGPRVSLHSAVAPDGEQ